MSNLPKGKATDISTAWSDYEWYPQGCYWFASRLNPSGEVEYDCRYDLPQQNPPLEQNVPRFTGPNIITSDDIYLASTSGGTIYGSGNLPGYTTANTSLGKPSGYDDLPALNSQGTYPPTVIGSSSLNITPGPAISYSRTINTSRLYPLTQNYPITAINRTPVSEDDVTQQFSNIALISPLTSPQQAYPTMSSSHTGIKIPNPPPNSGSYDELDPRYRVVDESHQKTFWKIGRVFMMLWTEPARSTDLNSFGGPPTTTSQFNQIYLKGMVFSEIRRFVVVVEGHGSCICSPIHTYNGQATLKPNLPEPLQHAIIYTSDLPPPEHSYQNSDGSIVRENLTKDPIKVHSQQRGFEGDLGTLSRVNYSKVYTVEKYNRVLNIGMVDRDSIQALSRNCVIKPREGPIEKPRRRPTRADSQQDARRGDGKKKGKESGKKHR